MRRSTRYLFVSSLFVEEEVLAQGDQAVRDHARRAEEVAATFQLLKD